MRTDQAVTIHRSDYTPPAFLVDRVTLVGHSLGGGISLEFCYLFPERVERLVLVGSGGLGREVNPLLRSATLPGAEWVLPVVASRRMVDRVHGVGRALAKMGWRPGSDLTAVWEGFTSLSDADSRRAFLATTRAVIDPGGQSVSAREYSAAASPLAWTTSAACAARTLAASAAGWSPAA